jgi:membrane associated rhomboid family serine protease/Zn-finger nucleic acid-binding protein
MSRMPRVNSARHAARTSARSLCAVVFTREKLPCDLVPAYHRAFAMFLCPGCQHRQARTEVFKGVVWVCEQCGGRVAAIATLRKVNDFLTIERYWARRRKSDAPRTSPCPVCTQRMREVSAGSEHPVLDVCNRCQLFWFDPGAYDRTPLVDPLIAQAARAQRLARERAAVLSTVDVQPNWQLAFCLFGLPLETSATRVRRQPLVTWWTAGIVAVLSLVAFLDLRHMVDLFGFVPARPWRLGGLTWITSFVLHVDIWHLLGNLYFLMVFGDNVEDFIGRAHFSVLLLLSIVSGLAAHALLDPTSTVPCIGASGGISGVMAFYALRFPKAQILIVRLFLPGGRLRPFFGRASASTFFLLWIALQVVGFIQQARGVSAVSAAAHLGGTLVGVLYWAVEERHHRASLAVPQ